MLSRIARTAILLACAAIIAESFVLWNATGRAVLTKYVDPARAARESKSESAGAPGAVADLFKDTGLEAHTGALAPPPNQFTLGLLPSGADKHIVSVTTIAGPAAVAAILTLASPALRRRHRREGAQE